MLRKQIKQRGLQSGAMVRLCCEEILRNEIHSHPNITFKEDHLAHAGEILHVYEVSYNNYGFDPEILLSNFLVYPETALRVVDLGGGSTGEDQPSLFDQNGEPVESNRTPTVENTNRPSNIESPDGLPIIPE
jgi:hypothetical protein